MRSAVSCKRHRRLHNAGPGSFRGLRVGTLVRQYGYEFFLTFEAAAGLKDSLLEGHNFCKFSHWRRWMLQGAAFA